MVKVLRALSFIVAIGTLATASAQDFQKSYQIGADGSVSVKNVSGDVSISGHDGSDVTVLAFKEGRDRDKVEVEDLSSGANVDVRAKYPERCWQDCNASLRFEVRVPRNSRINLDKISTASGDIKAIGFQAGRVRLNTASGDVDVRDISGAINAQTASGDVAVVDASGTVNAQSASGDVEVQIARLEGAEGMKFSTASGDVSVRMPPTLDADVEMSTVSGRVETDFPIEVKEPRYGPGSNARGRLGSGSRPLRISSASGNVSLKTIGSN